MATLDSGIDDFDSPGNDSLSLSESTMSIAACYRDMNENATEVQSVGRVFAIVEVIADLETASLAAIADETDIPESTVYRYLVSLEEDGYVVKEDGGYEIGLRFLRIGRLAQMKREEYQFAKSITEELAAETNERAQFTVAEHGYVFGVYKATGERAVETDNYIGKPNPMHATSTGKAILAQWNEEEILELIENRGLPALTENTITDVDELLDELTSIQESGVSYNRQENTEGLRAVAVPVNGPDGVFGALGVSGPAHRMRGEWFESELPDLLLGSSNELELRIKYSG